jgi:hypothetical protein
MLEFEGSIEPVACAALSPLPVLEKGKAKKLKVVRCSFVSTTCVGEGESKETEGS